MAVSKCAEQWDCALLSLTHKCKKAKFHTGSSLDKYIRASAGMDITIERVNETTKTHDSLQPAATGFSQCAGRMERSSLDHRLTLLPSSFCAMYLLRLHCRAR